MYFVFMSLNCWLFLLFFFKQKTAYEMRISDWSSDVCSSDLKPAGAYKNDRGRWHVRFFTDPIPGSWTRRVRADRAFRQPGDTRVRLRDRGSGAGAGSGASGVRSEEHTSELPSLMRISYAVLRLKKNKINNHRHAGTNQ